MLIWGVKDSFFERSLAQPSIDCVDDDRLVISEEAIHWMHREEPAKIRELIAAFLQVATETTKPAERSILDRLGYRRHVPFTIP